MRKVLKILHSIAACGLIGGLGCYMILLVAAPQETPAAYADLRHAIAAISNYLLLPSLAIVLLSGLLAMATHHPFLDKGWALLKAALGILMFKGVLTIVGAKADHAAVVSRQIADGEPVAEVLDAALAQEWLALGTVMALSVANVVLGVWRPRLARRTQSHAQRTPEAAAGTDAGSGERARPAA
ncbi:DUF2269 family protein [Pelagibius sp.]|uniref:DUF2269 family protein n=1 Tax=Pelagibius sp. TaxID=1931238 RepID=UPI003B504CA5